MADEQVYLNYRQLYPGILTYITTDENKVYEKIPNNLLMYHMQPCLLASIAEMLPKEDSEETASEKTIDEIVTEDSSLCTPSEYYAGATVTNEVTNVNEPGYLKDTNYVTSIVQSWFWVEELHNWCTYIVDTQTYSFKNIFKLCYWNGRDSWLPVNIENNPEISWSPILVATKGVADTTKIAGVVNSVLKEAQQTVHGNYYNAIINVNGSISIPGISNDESNVKWWNRQTFLNNIAGLRITSTNSYSINDKDTFQTKRWSTQSNHLDGSRWDPFFKNENNDFNGGGVSEYMYTHTNNRRGITTYIPTIWRLPTDEICLSMIFEYNGDNGFTYWYIIENGVVVKYSPVQSMIVDQSTNSNIMHFIGGAESSGIMGGELTKVMKFINDSCKEIFGDGNSKTIKNDWLRPNKLNNNINNQLKDGSMLDSTKILEQRNVNTINKMKCIFKVNRPVVVTNEGHDMDYVRKW